MNQVTLNRQDLIAKLEWILWENDHPTVEKPDLVSVIAVSLPTDKYTDEELVKLVEFAEERNAIYDRMFRYRRGCNMIVIDKQGEDRWLRKRMSWEYGPMFSPSLDEALAIFRRGI